MGRKASKKEKRKHIVADVKKKVDAYTAFVVHHATECSRTNSSELSREPMRIDYVLKEFADFSKMHYGKQMSTDVRDRDNRIYTENGLKMGFQAAREIVAEMGYDLRDVSVHDKKGVIIFLARNGVQIPEANRRQWHGFANNL